MINVQTRWQPWTGAAVTAAASDYADMKFRPVSSRLTNGELVGLAAIAVDVLGYGGKYRAGVAGGSDWAVGNLVSSFVRTKLTSPVPVVTTTHAAATSNSAGLAGIPASGGSSAFDLPTGGY